MAEEDQYNSGNWWDLPSSRNSAVSSGSSSSSSAITPGGGGGWVQGGGVSTDTGVAVAADSTSGVSSSSIAVDYTNFMGLGLSSPSSQSWNQPELLTTEKGVEIGSFRSMLQEGMATSSSTTNYHQDETTARVTGSMLFCSTNNIQQSCLFRSNQQQQQQQQQQTPSPSSSMYNYGTYHQIPDNGDRSGNYGLLLPSGNENPLLDSSSNWSINKLPEFQRPSTPADDSTKTNQLLQFTNNGPFWYSSSSNNMGDHDQASGFFPPLMQNRIAVPLVFEEKPKINPAMEVRENSGTSTSSAAAATTSTKKSASATTRTNTAGSTNTKRSRSEGSSTTTMPPFKVRKEKMGDRITALQQLVSPFGKTDTASVLSEAIEYIKFLHEQVSLLTTPYLKSGSSLHQMVTSDKSSNDPEDLRKPDLRSRGLCLVPVSSTFPVTHETSVDFWTPTFGGTFR